MKHCGLLTSLPRQIPDPAAVASFPIAARICHSVYAEKSDFAEETVILLYAVAGIAFALFRGLPRGLCGMRRYFKKVDKESFDRGRTRGYSSVHSTRPATQLASTAQWSTMTYVSSSLSVLSRVPSVASWIKTGYGRMRWTI
jgi:hypothetical protein